MHQRERHRAILRQLQEQHVVTVRNLARRLAASEASIRRDITELARQGALKRIHGGAEAVEHQPPPLHGRPFSVSQTINVAAKRAIGRAAAALCHERESIIINGGSTTFMMAHYLEDRQLQVLTNSLPIAEQLLQTPGNRLLLPGGEVFREQSIILNPFDTDGSEHFYAMRLFTGAQSVSARGIMETDSILVTAENRLMKQADEIVVLVDSTKFHARGSLIVCALERVDLIITDTGVTDRDAAMVETAGVRLLAVEPETGHADASAEAYAG